MLLVLSAAQAHFPFPILQRSVLASRGIPCYSLFADNYHATNKRTPNMDNCAFLRLPRELRDRIYRSLVSVKYTKTPKDVKAGFRSAASRYDWNLDPVILRVNKQIHEEAQEVMARDNDFVVVQPTVDKVEQTEDDLREEDESIIVYSVELWPGKGTMMANVPGERMRIWLGKHGQPVGGSLYVMLVEELRDFCVALSMLMGTYGRYRINGLDAYITLRPAAEGETPRAKKERQDALLQPLSKLRKLGSVQILGVESEVESQYKEQMTRLGYDEDVAYSTINELITSGDQARELGHFDVATAYYQRASEYFHHFVKHERTIFSNPADPLAFEFKIMQHRALNGIEGGNFLDAFECAKIALHLATQLFRIDAPVTDPPIDARGRISKGALRQWNCNWIKSGAARFGQRIKCEDVGRVFYYKSFSERLHYWDEANEQADEDKYTAIGCCLVSETATDANNIIQELLELVMRTIARLRADDGGEEDEWEDEEWEDEEWEDEEN